jgi:F-type H+-transporting ATPase subunit epsilon
VAAAKLKVSVISPERTVYEGDAEQVVAPAWDGEIGILRGHAPLLVLLGDGDVRVRTGGQDHRFHISGGFMQVVDDVVTILSERAQQS